MTMVPFIIEATGSVFAVDPARLAIEARFAGGATVSVSAPLARPLDIGGFAGTADRLEWTVPSRDLHAAIDARGSGISVRFTTRKAQDLEWPLTGGDPAVRALILPNGSGVHVPVGDRFWRKLIGSSEFDASGGLLMPFWGFQLPGSTLTYIWPESLRNVLVVADRGGHLTARARHEFRSRDGFPPYEVHVAIGGPSPVQPALEFRRHLQETGQFKTLREKIAAKPEAAKLLGATHAYLWVDGRTTDALAHMQALGLDRLLLAYDQDPKADRYAVGAAFIARARAIGHLLAPYQTYNNIQDPRQADAPDAVFSPELFATGGIMRRDGTRMKGFAGRGFQLSSEALSRDTQDFLAQRVEAQAKTGINGIFLDSDAFGDLYDDYDPMHAMTAFRDRENRLARLRAAGDDRKLVLGSEEGVAWSVPALDFAHGAHAIHTDLLWDLLKRPSFKGKWNNGRPGTFFDITTVDDAVRKALYDPFYRVPLYQAVFHDALVGTDRYEFSPIKLRGLESDRILLELLYLVPPVWNLDLRVLGDHGTRIAALHRFFSPLHKEFGAEPLTRFEWLMPDRLVQRTRFGDGLQLTANFSMARYGDLPPKAIEARWLKTGRKLFFRP
jgi:hypothetical protein